MNPELLDIFRTATANRFRFFVEQFWGEVSNDKFKGGYLVDTLCDHLQALHAGTVKRLAVALPIRHGKTIISQVFFPAWCWARDPELRFILASHTLDKAIDSARQLKELVDSELYRQCFPSSVIEGDQKAKEYFLNAAGGKVKACGTGTRISGYDADYVLADDLIDYDHAKSDADRTQAIEFYSGQLSKRLVAGTGKDRILVAGHRVHEADLFAHIWDTWGNEGTWSYLVLPAEAKPEVTNSYHNGTGWKDTRAEGELLWRERFNEQWLAHEKIDLRRKYSCVYQQDPSPAEGDLFKAEWFRYYTQDAETYTVDGKQYDKQKAWRFCVVDTAISTSSTADYTVAQCWDVVGKNLLLVAQLRKRLDGTQIVPALAAFYDLYRPQFMCVEREFVGRFVLDQLRERNVCVKGFDAKRHGGKETRAVAAEIRLEAAQVYFPKDEAKDEKAGWVAELEREVLAFPNGAHDDQVDCLSMACTMADRYIGKAEPVLSPEEQQARAAKEKREQFNRMLWSGCPF